MKGIELSIVIPVRNEEKNVPILYERLKKVLEKIDVSYEIIFVDDGSEDKTFDVLKDIKKREKNLRIIQFCRNFGQTQALYSGFEHSKGSVIIAMDGDLENDPEDIPLMLKKLKEGYDVVSGWRRHRKDPLFTKKLPSFLANKLISSITGIKLHDHGCTFKAYRSEVIKKVRLYGEMHRFIPALVGWDGANIAEVEVKHNRRIYGESSYGLSRTFGVILDLITAKFFLNYFTSPIRIFGMYGIFSIFLGILSGIAVVLMKLLAKVDMTGNPLLYLTVLLIIVGIQFIAIGLLGELNTRIYYESQNKPTYRIKTII